ncbi:hypothetical protein [Nocardia carnea]|uniref:Uncharacterized protein n=1 Tax=Nocardia carnea TaxID=37328 RepID=A0ABW7TUL9_9NOCA|nr:hypothetical protein [Nocardia carnea]
MIAQGAVEEVLEVDGEVGGGGGDGVDGGGGADSVAAVGVVDEVEIAGGAARWS